MSDNFFDELEKDDSKKNNGDSRFSGVGSKKKLFIAVIIIIVLVAGGLVWAITKSQKTGSAAAGGAAVATADQKQQTADLLQKVGHHLDLPAGETPQIYVVQDASKLIAQQQFWTGSSNGDVALIYMNARKAVIYSPSRDKVVNVGPIYFAGNPATQSGASSVAKPAAPSVKSAVSKP